MGNTNKNWHLKKWKAYTDEIIKALEVFEFDAGILDLLKGSLKKDQKIFVAGNGGSAALSMHYVCDLSKGANRDWGDNLNRYQAICLTSNIGYMTAISNDTSYDGIFKHQLVNLASPDDILILISSSGNSPNIIEALKYAKEAGMITIGISGFDGGALKEHCDYSAHINHPSYEVCEDIHSVFGHFLAVCLREME